MSGAKSVAEVSQSLFRNNRSLLVLVGGVAVPAIILSVLIGLNPGFTVFLLLLFFGVAYGLGRWRARTQERDGTGRWNLGLTALLSAVIVGIAIQAVPYGHSQSNGAIVKEPAWPSDHVRSLVVRACYDCHSNEVNYPAYSKVAPLSWLVADHVSEGRAALNFSDIGSKQGGRDIVETIQEGSMPPASFTRFGLHKNAKLTKAEAAELVAAIKSMPEFKR